jgi:hypothetical protein
MAGRDLCAMFRMRLLIAGTMRRMAVLQKRGRLARLLRTVGVFVREGKAHRLRRRLAKTLSLGCVGAAGRVLCSVQLPQCPPPPPHTHTLPTPLLPP